MHFFVTDNPQRFASLGAKFLHEPLGQVSYVPLDALIEDLGGALGALASGKVGTGIGTIAEIGSTGDLDQPGGVG